jgi:hypothetical protein
MLTAAILEAFENPAIRAALIGLIKDVGTEMLPELRVLALDVITDIFHHHAANPDFINQSTALFVKRAQATTKEEKDAAQQALMDLMATPANT